MLLECPFYDTDRQLFFNICICSIYINSHCVTLINYETMIDVMNKHNSFYLAIFLTKCFKNCKAIT